MGAQHNKQVLVLQSWILSALQSLSQPQSPQCILESNVKPSVQQLKLGWNLVMKQSSDAKHTSKSTQSLKKKKKEIKNKDVTKAQSIPVRGLKHYRGAVSGPCCNRFLPITMKQTVVKIQM